MERLLRRIDLPEEFGVRKVLADPAAAVQRDQEFHPDQRTGRTGH